MKKPFSSALAAITLVFAASCAPQTPDSRISMRPDVYERLSENEKQLVRNGEIAKGMDRDAVALAWGSPSAQVEGLRNGRRMERWDYNGSEPVVTNTFYGGYSSGIYGPYSYSGIGAGIGPQVSYVPVREASVWFIGGRVDEWERIR